MRRTARTLWRGSWILVLPWLFLFSYWLSGTIVRYLDVAVDQMGDINLGTLSLRQTGALEFHFRARQVELDLMRALRLLPPDDLPRVDLYISESALNSLNADLPASGFTYVRGLMNYMGVSHRIRARYRGDFPVHWGFFKKSWRIKTRKKDLVDGRYRSLNLIRPKTGAQQSNFVGYEIARSLGLITPHTQLVTLSVNGNYAGLYLLVEQEDESTLRNLNRLPGDLYVGDQLYGVNKWSGLDSSVFDHPGLWEKAAVDNNYPEARTAPLKELLYLVRNANSDEAQRRLEEILDFEAFARLNLLEVLLCSHHYDLHHNWKLYFDPGRGRFYPVIWDPLPWHPDWLPGGVRNTWFDDHTPPAYVVASPLMRALYLNANFMRVRGRVFREYFSGPLPDRLIRELRQIEERLAPVLTKDPSLMDAALNMITPEEALTAMDRQRAIARIVIERMRSLYGNPPAQEVAYRWEDAHTLLLGVSTHGTVESLRFAAPERPSGTVSLAISNGSSDTRVDITARAAWRDGVLELAVPLVADLDWYESPRAYNDNVRRREGVYRIEFANPVAPAPVEVSFGTAWAPAREDGALVRAPLLPTMQRVTALARPEAPLFWKGDVRIREDRRITAPLTIAGGTTVRLAAGASLFLEGRLTIEGQDAPVTIEGLTGEPWGALIIEGHKADGSHLDGVTIQGGSGVRNALRQYSGMLSIHDVDNVTLSNCVIRDNRLMDDMVHLVYGSMTVDGCSLERAPFDGLDVDLGHLTVKSSQFLNNGNDGIDLMGSYAHVTDSRFTGNGDKGISVGERTEIVATGNQFTGNAFAVQTKDDSISVLADNRFDGNQVALDAYKKNWRYGAGGHVVTCHNEESGNGEGNHSDRDSIIVAEGCGIISNLSNGKEELERLRRQLQGR